MSKSLLFSPLRIRETTLKNRVVVAPMHQYSSVKGYPIDWHLVNAGRWATGGAGCVMIESTKVERRGCGTIGDLGLWHDDFIPHYRRLADFIRENSAVPAIQLGHSGRKARRFRPWEGGTPLVPSDEIDDWDDWELVAPSAIAQGNDPEPRALNSAELPDVVDAWGKAAERAHAAGFEILEIHAAHGYLLHQFLSPEANRRNDRYGGSDENRMRFPVEVAERVRSVWPLEKPLFMRFSVTDEAGWTPDNSVVLARAVKAKGVDVIDCSSGGMRGSPVRDSGPITYGYQVPYAQKIRTEADIMSMAVGLIVHAGQAEEILQNGEADLIALAREVLYNPNWPVDAALKLEEELPFDLMPPQYRFWLEKRAQGASDVVPSTFPLD